MRVLVACEYSGTVRDAFLGAGHDAMSCDLLPTERPGPHHQGDVRAILRNGWDLGCCRLYDHFHPDGLCWDDPATHRKLVDRLATNHPDGWALSCHTPSLATILPMCPDRTRVAAWVKPFHIYCSACIGNCAECCAELKDDMAAEAAMERGR